MTNQQTANAQIPGFYLIESEQFKEEVPVAIENYKRVLSGVKGQEVASWEASIQPLEEAAEQLDRVWGLLEHLNAVANTPEIRAVHDELLPVVSNFYTDLMQDEAIYKIYLELSQSPTFATLSSAQREIITHEIRDFKLSGVGLPLQQREKFKQLVERLNEIENQFAHNVLDSTDDWSYHVTPQQEMLLDGLPEHLKEHAKQRAAQQKLHGWVLTLDAASYSIVIAHAANRQLREEFYQAYYTRASKEGELTGKWDNTPIIAEILQIRQQLARLVGFANYAEYALATRMAKNPSHVNDFLHDLVTKVKPQAQQDFIALSEFAKQQGFAASLEPWDVAYFSEKMLQANYNISEEELRVYFPEPRVLTGLFKLVRKLFGIEIEEASNFETWHPSVRMFKVIDRNQNLRGHFYIDLYAREGKQSGAWVNGCLSRIRFANNQLQNPASYLVCNFSPPVGNQPGLLTHHDVVTLFHEFGHNLHHILTQVDYYSVSGMHVPLDAVELPSQFMENWAWEWQVMQDISENINTGEPLSLTMFNNLLASKNFHAAMWLLRQLEFATFDFRIHENNSRDEGRSAHDILQNVRREISVLPLPRINRFENGFAHIFASGHDYSAGYYSYLWAEVLSCDAFDIFKAEGLFNEQIGLSFLENILEKGGSEPAMDLFVAFAGREPKIDALLRHHAIT